MKALGKDSTMMTRTFGYRNVCRCLISKHTVHNSKLQYQKNNTCTTTSPIHTSGTAIGYHTKEHMPIFQSATV